MHYLRPVVYDDVRLIYEWGNYSLVRFQSFYSKSIDWEEHNKWFNDIMNRDNILFYILNINKIEVGMIRLELCDGIVQINYSICEKYRKNGYGKMILYLGERKLIELYDDKYILEAYVKVNNEASKRLFEKLDYKKYLSNEDYIVYRKYCVKC